MNSENVLRRVDLIVILMIEYRRILHGYERALSSTASVGQALKDE